MEYKNLLFSGKTDCLLCSRLLSSGRLLALLLTTNISFSSVSAQNDTMYIMKAGVIINQQSIKPDDVDSIVFYKPSAGELPNTASYVARVLIPAGTFTMGSPEDEVNRATDETQFAVTLTAFHMSRYEITNAQYAAFLNSKSIGSNGMYAAGSYPIQALIYASSGNYDWGLHFSGSQWLPVAGYENFPVVNVTWYGAMEFATYVGGTLPTEAQWEYACRAGTSTPFNTGVCLSNTQANYWWSLPYNTCTNSITTQLSKPQPVGTYAPNSFGLYDMHGNVWERCSDWYDTYPASAQTNPTGAATGSKRVIRGGCYLSYGRGCRSALRTSYPLEAYWQYIGFRVVFVP